MTVYKIAVPSFETGTNVDFSVPIGDDTLRFVCELIDNKWNFAVWRNDADKRIGVFNNNTTYFANDKVYSLLTDDVSSLSGMTIYVGVQDVTAI